MQQIVSSIVKAKIVDYRRKKTLFFSEKSNFSEPQAEKFLKFKDPHFEIKDDFWNFLAFIDKIFR